MFEQWWFLHSLSVLEFWPQLVFTNPGRGASRIPDGAICSEELRSNRSLPLLQNSISRVLGDVLQYRLQYEAPDKLCGFYLSFTFYLQIRTILSGADGIRTHALRRAKAAQYFAEAF